MQQGHAEAALAVLVEARLPCGGAEREQLDGVAAARVVARQVARPLPPEEVGPRGGVAAEGHAVGAAAAVERRHGQAGPEHEAALGGREHARQRRREHQLLREDEARPVAAAVGAGERLGEHQRRARDAEAEQLRAQAGVVVVLLLPTAAAGGLRVRRAGGQGQLLDRPRRRVRVVAHDPLLEREKLRRDAAARWAGHRRQWEEEGSGGVLLGGARSWWEGQEGIFHRILLWDWDWERRNVHLLYVSKNGLHYFIKNDQ
jgi:hypothetical protein